MAETGTMRWLDEAERRRLAAAMPDTPQTAMSTHRLRWNLARAAVIGPIARPAAAIVQAHALTAEPALFGDDPALLWALLRACGGWTGPHAAVAAAAPLAALIRAETGRRVRLEEEIYFRDTGAPFGAGDAAPSAVRRLTAADIPLIEAATEAMGMTGWRFGSAAAQVAHGFAAGAVVDGRLVTVAFTAARSARYGEIGIHTLAPHRGRGYASAAAALVAADLRRAGLTVVWSTGAGNLPSRRIAATLGLVEESRRVNLYAVE